MSAPATSTILLVDDSPLGRRSLAAPLEGLDYTLFQASDGYEALQIADRERPDLILMDVKMPGMDGIEACRRLRRDPNLAEIPVLLITGHDDTTRLEGLEAGADDYLIKPFDPAEFRARVRTITRLNRYRHVYSSRAKFEQLVELSPDGILLVDTEGLIQLANPAAAELLGAGSTEELIRADLLSFMPTEEQMAWAEHLAGALSGQTSEQARHIEGSIVTRAGKRRQIEAFTGSFHSEGAATAQLILRDVTFRKESEAAIRKLNLELEQRVEERTRELAQEMQEHQASEEELRVSQQRLQSALEAAQQGLWEWDLPGDELLYDDRWAALHDCAEEGISRGLAGWEECICQEDRSIVRRSLNHSQSGDGWFEAEYRIKRRSQGGPRWILVRGRIRERDSAGRPLRMIGTAQDLTARKELETELLRAKDRAEQATRAKSEFLANMSHEIRTPLNAVLGFCELLERDITQPQHMEYLKAINAGGRSLLSLINDILDLSKIEAGRLTLQLEPVDTASMCREIRGIFMEKSRQKGIEFLLDIAPEVKGKLMLDAVRLRQVLFNIIGNAIKFTRNGHVKLNSCMDGQSIVFTVEDTGIGIPEADLTTIFEAFRQKSGQSTREFGGTGLGLTISRRLVEMMEGVISVDSRPGNGTTFTVRLPANRAEDDGATSDAIADPQDAPWEFEEAVVLVVDDNRLNRELVLAVLRDSPLTLMEASSGEEALHMAQTHQPDVMLLDLRMPGMDGRDVAERMRQDQGTSWIPILLLTAAATTEETQAAQLIGVDGFLTKPVRRQSLLRELRRFLPTRQVEVKEPAALENGANGSADADTDALREEQGANGRVQAAAAPTLLRELIPWLKGPLKTDWKDARESLMVSKIEVLADELKAAGKDHDLPSLVDLGNEMMVAVQSYDVERMLTSLEKYPACVEDLEQSIRAAMDVSGG